MWLWLEEKPQFHIPLELVSRHRSRQGGGQLRRTFAHGPPPYAGTAVECFDVQSTLSPSLEYARDNPSAMIGANVQE